MPSIEELKEAVKHWEEVEKMVVHHLPGNGKTKQAGFVQLSLIRHD